MPTPTYEPIQSTTLTQTTTGVEFSSIPQTYTDLVVIAFLKYNGTGPVTDVPFRLNGISTSIYHDTTHKTNGTTGTFGSNRNATYFRAPEYLGTNHTPYTILRLDILGYSSTSFAKSILSQLSSVGASNNYVSRTVGMFASTSAITSVNFDPLGTPGFVTGSKFSLYGIKQAV